MKIFKKFISRRTVTLIAVIMLLFGSRFPAMGALVLGPDINISNQNGAQSEVGIAVDPTNPLNIVAVSNNIADLSRLGTWFSSDGGATWTPNFIDENEDGFGANDSRFDPNVAFDSDGNVYIVYSTTGTGNRLLLAISTDGGQNFNQVTTVTTDAPAASNLHTAMVTTRSDAGGADDVLVVWARVQAGGESIEASLSLDAGATFPTTNNNINDAQQRTFLPWASVDNAGNFHVVWEVNQGGGAGVILHDTLNGVTLADGATNTQVTTVQITDFAAATSLIPAQPDRGLFSVSTVDVDRTTGRVFVSYTDRPNTASNDTDIYVRFSNDNGATWSARTQINDDTTTTSQFLPRMAIDQSNGDVWTVWYDARNDVANNQQVDIFSSKSVDGGLTWLANQQVTTAVSDESTANAARDGNNYGEYFGLIAANGFAHVAWTDARAANFTAGTNEDVYTARMQNNIAPNCDANGPYPTECQGATTTLTLDGTGSSDPNPDDTLTYAWTTSCPSGSFDDATSTAPVLTVDSSSGATVVCNASLTVTDTCGASDSCSSTVTIVDTTPPDIQCNAPATITPPNAPISFTATATDICTGDPFVEIIGYDCFKFTKKGKRIDKTESCIVDVDGDTITIVDSGGVDDNITWTVRAVDNSGNVTESVCSIMVVNPGKKP
jgi:hypothetical protein